MQKIIILGLILGLIISGVFLENTLENKKQDTLEKTGQILLSGKCCRASTVFKTAGGSTKILLLK